MCTSYTASNQQYKEGNSSLIRVIRIGEEATWKNTKYL